MAIESNEAQATQEAPAQDVAGASLTLNDLKVVLQLIQITSARGAFKPEEFQAVGALYDKLFKFLDASGALAPAPAEEAPAEEAPAEEAPAGKKGKKGQ